MKQFAIGDRAVIVRGPRLWQGQVGCIKQRLAGMRGSYLMETEARGTILVTAEQLREVPSNEAPQSCSQPSN